MHCLLELRLGALRSIVLNCKVLKRENVSIVTLLFLIPLVPELVLVKNELKFLPLTIGSLKLLRILNFGPKRVRIQHCDNHGIVMF